MSTEVCHRSDDPMGHETKCGKRIASEPWCCSPPRDPDCGRPKCPDCYGPQAAADTPSDTAVNSEQVPA